MIVWCAVRAARRGRHQLARAQSRLRDAALRAHVVTSGAPGPRRRREAALAGAHDAAAPAALPSSARGAEAMGQPRSTTAPSSSRRRPNPTTRCPMSSSSSTSPAPAAPAHARERERNSGRPKKRLWGAASSVFSKQKSALVVACDVDHEWPVAKYFVFSACSRRPRAPCVLSAPTDLVPRCAP